MAINEQLPYEIYTDIFSYLPLSDLLNTSMVSHHMRAISQSLLYKAPILTNNDDWTKPSSLQLLLRTLLSPGGETLATLVRSLHVKWDERVDQESRSKLPLECPSGVTLLADAAIRLGLDQSLTSQTAQLVLLLHLLPHLSVLNIAPPDDSSDGCGVFSEFLESHSVAHSTKTLPLGLRQLREFRFSSGLITGRVSSSALLTILNLPCIRSIDVLIRDSFSPFPAAEAASATSTVTHLRLPFMSLPTQSLRCILKIPIALTHLSFSAGRPDPELCIMQALQPLQASLQHLHVEWTGAAQPLGSLRGWPALRTVSCSLTVLLGRKLKQDSPRLTDILPASLRELVVMREYYWNGTAAADQLEELVRRKEAIVPELEMLVVPLGDPQMWRDEQAKVSLREACEAAAVELVDIKSPAWEGSLSRCMC